VFTSLVFRHIFLKEALNRESEGTTKSMLIVSMSVTKEGQGLAGL
jgi:hypothetical protein